MEKPTKAYISSHLEWGWAIISLYQFMRTDFGQFAKIDTITLCIRNETFLPFFGRKRMQNVKV